MKGVRENALHKVKEEFKMILDRNENKEVVVLLGAGSMGCAIVRRIAAGKKILLGDISEKALERVSHEFTYSGYDVETQIVDACDGQSIRAFAEKAASLGPVMYYIHTAGASPRFAIIRLQNQIVWVCLFVCFIYCPACRAAHTRSRIKSALFPAPDSHRRQGAAAQRAPFRAGQFLCQLWKQSGPVHLLLSGAEPHTPFPPTV